MKRIILCLLELLFIFISCDSNPCVISIYSLEEKKGFELPKVYWIKFYPSKVKVGDTVLVMYEKEIKSNTSVFEKELKKIDKELALLKEDLQNALLKYNRNKITDY